MADGSQVPGVVVTPLSGSPLAGLMVKTEGADTSVPALWTTEAEPNLTTAGVRVTVQRNDPALPTVTGTVVAQ